MSFCWFYIPFLCSHYIPMFFVKSLISIYGKSSPELFPAESPKDTISYCWSYPPYPSLSRFSWCYPTNCCIKWPFSIIDIPCYGCSRNLSSVENAKGTQGVSQWRVVLNRALMGLVTASDGDGTHWEGPKDISLVNVYITTGNHHAIHGGKKTN